MSTVSAWSLCYCDFGEKSGRFSASSGDGEMGCQRQAVWLSCLWVSCPLPSWDRRHLHSPLQVYTQVGCLFFLDFSPHGQAWPLPVPAAATCPGLRNSCLLFQREPSWCCLSFNLFMWAKIKWYNQEQYTDPCLEGQGRKPCCLTSPQDVGLWWSLICAHIDGTLKSSLKLISGPTKSLLFLSSTISGNRSKQQHPQHFPYRNGPCCSAVLAY